MTRYKREPTSSTTSWRCSKSGRTSAHATLSCTILFASANVTRCTARVILIDSMGENPSSLERSSVVSQSSTSKAMNHVTALRLSTI